MNIVEIKCEKARQGGYFLNKSTSEEKNQILEIIAKSIEDNMEKILEHNAKDIALLSEESAFKDRLLLNENRVKSMVEGVRQLIMLADPVGCCVKEWTVESGLNIKKMRMPLGVIGVIYEARPNVTVDVASLCIKSGNSVVLKGGSDALNSNLFIYNTMIKALEEKGIPTDFIQFIEGNDRSLTYELLKQDKYLDVIIPRGGDKLKKYILENSAIPVLASSGGNCHIYIDESADIEKAINIVINAKTQRTSACNACEQLLINKDIAPIIIPKLFAELEKQNVKIKGCLKSAEYFNIENATEADYFTEHLRLEITTKIVDNVCMATEWINIHNTKHSDAIVTENQKNADYFARNVDSGCVYINASTRFTDGFEFGFGAEIGISTQKLHARGPLGLEQLTCEKYVCTGNGNCRK